MPRFKRYEYDRMASRAMERFNQDRPGTVAVDTETEGFAWDDPAFCVTLTWRDKTGELVSCYLDLETDDHGTRLAVARQMLFSANRWVFHNAKFDLQKLLLEGCIERDWIEAQRIDDTNIVHALIDENSRHGLKYLAKTLLGESTNEEQTLAKVRRKLKIKKDDGYHLLPREYIVPYAMRDTELTLMLFEYLWPKLPEDCYDLYVSEVETAIALLDIEANGIGVDVPYLETAASEYGVKLMRLDMALQKLGGDPETGAKFNPNSPKQIQEAFLKNTGLGLDSTAKDNLTKIAEGPNEAAAKLAATLLEHRKVKKLHGTYLTGMLAEQRDGIIHPNFNLTLPRTGRMSSSSATNN